MLESKERIFLITAAGGDVGAAVVRCIRKAYPQSIIIGTDIKKFVQSADSIDELVQLPHCGCDDYLTELLRICKQKKVTHLCPISEGEIAVISKHLETIERMGVKTAVHPYSMIKTLQSKYETSIFLAKHGIQTPATYRYCERNNITSFPVIAKLDCGCGAKGMHTLKSKEELEHLKLTDDWILQKKVGTDEEEYTMAIFSSGTDTVNFICFRRKLGMGSMSVYVETVDFPWLKSLAVQVANAFQLKGSINIQFRMENEQYYIFEINARLSSSVRFRDMMGFRDAFWWVQMLDGEVVSACNVTSHYVGVKQTGEIVFKLFD